MMNDSKSPIMTGIADIEHPEVSRRDFFQQIRSGAGPVRRWSPMCGKPSPFIATLPTGRNFALDTSISGHLRHVRSSSRRSARAAGCRYFCAADRLDIKSMDAISSCALRFPSSAANCKTSLSELR